MYLEFFGLKEQPFSIAPDPRYLYMSERHREALAHLLYGVNGQGGFVVLTGEVGTGKTTICRCFLHQVPKNTDVAYVVNPKLSARELLATICDELKIPYADSASIKVLNDAINHYLLRAHADNRHTVLIIDEAQNLRVDVLEQLRLLTNLETSEKKLLQIILLGQPELREKLARQELRQLNQRVTARYHLTELNKVEVGAYLQCRLAVAGRKGRLFTLPAVNLIYKLSGGIPRLINLIADRALLGAYAAQSEVIEKSHIKHAHQEIQGDTRMGVALGQRRWWVAVVAAPVLVLAVFWFLSPATQLVEGLDVAAVSTAGESDAGLHPSQRGTPSKTEVKQETFDNDSARVVEANEQPQKRPSLVQASSASNEGEASTDTNTDAIASGSPPSPDREHPIIEEFKEALNSSAENPLVYAEAETPDLKAARDPAELMRASSGNTDFPFLQTLSDRQGSTLGKFRAFQAVFERWNVNYGQEPFTLACEFAELNGLRCLHKQGNWRSLLRLDRPAVLTLFNHEGNEFYLALLRIKEDKAEVDHDGMRFWVSLDEIDRHWLGEYSVLWRLPPYKSQIVRPGQLNEEQWLATHLDRLLAETLHNREALQAGMSLSDKVRAFQRHVGLVPDGIAGSMTIIHMNNLLGAQCPSLLGKG